MEKKTMTVLTPDFYSDFHCVAGDCRNNCCVHPWAILVEKKNYKQLRDLREPKWLAENLGSYVKRNDNSKNENDYAKVIYNERGCAFQTEDGLCRLQLELGAEYLSSTCTSYPRIDNYFIAPHPGGAIVNRGRSLTISCEEVARMLLHKPEPIAFIATEASYNPASFDSEKRHANSCIVAKDRPILEHYSLIRAVGIAVLQNRDYTIEQRLILLVVYFDKLAQAEQSETTDTIPDMTDTFVQAVDERLYDQLFAATPIPSVTALLTNIASVYSFSAGSNTSIVQRCGVGISSVDYLLRAESYRIVMADNAHLMEHLLVCELFNKALPFASKHSINDCIQYMVSIFTIFRFMLGSYLGDRHTITEVELIDFVAYFGKTVLHSHSSFDRNIELLKINNMDTLAYMVAIIIG